MTIDQTETEKAAYEMVEAYKREKNLLSAVNSVAENSPIAYNTLLGMWHAIDAYVDLNT